MATLTIDAMQVVAARCVDECVRQGVGIGALGRLLIAYDHALANADALPTEADLCTLAGIIEPQLGGAYRTTPVTFDAGGIATDWRSVSESVSRLFTTIDRDVDEQEVVRALLRIHPFGDGNGRVTFIIYNWLGGRLSAPRPLPDFEW